MKSVVLASVAMNVQYDKRQNLATCLKYIEEAASQGANLIVFPEQCLQGYLRHLNQCVTSADIKYQYDEAEVVPSGPSTQAIIAAASQHGIYVVFGMTERDADRYDVLYNTSVLVGPEGYIGRYRKVHQPGDEVHVYWPGDDFPVFHTQIGKIGMLICYDKAFPEVARALASQGAEILAMPTAWALAVPGGDVSTDASTDNYILYDRVRAVENGCFFISANQIGICGDLDYLGHSQVVSPKGTVLASTGYKDGLVTAEVNVREDILDARAYDISGMHLKDRKPAVYEKYQL